jgi:hypothetical protein
MVDCGGKKTHFGLNGTLFFLSRNPRNFPSIKQEKGSVPDDWEIKLPHLSFLFWQALGTIPQMCLAFLAGAGLLAGAYLVAKIIPFYSGGPATAATANAMGQALHPGLREEHIIRCERRCPHFVYVHNTLYLFWFIFMCGFSLDYS